mmetsp:Transcript_10842/g.21794  ORF Transcript_10842/g.21794 Transcript_10842/m.21794 type:complete len:250 (-) Transcript_10842:923-1672(-)
MGMHVSVGRAHVRLADQHLRELPENKRVAAVHKQALVLARRPNLIRRRPLGSQTQDLDGSAARRAHRGGGRRLLGPVLGGGRAGVVAAVAQAMQGPRVGGVEREADPACCGDCEAARVLVHRGVPCQVVVLEGVFGAIGKPEAEAGGTGLERAIVGSVHIQHRAIRASSVHRERLRECVRLHDGSTAREHRRGRRGEEHPRWAVLILMRNRHTHVRHLLPATMGILNQQTRWPEIEGPIIWSHNLELLT